MTLSDEINFGYLPWILKLLYNLSNKSVATDPMFLNYIRVGNFKARWKSSWQMTFSDEINFGCLRWVIKVIWSIRKKVLQSAPVSYTLWRHSYVTPRLIFMILICMNKADPNLYYGTNQHYFEGVEITGRGSNHTPSLDVLQKCLR